METWAWSVGGCGLRSYSNPEMLGLLSNRPVFTIGDSIARNFHVALARQVRRCEERKAEIEEEAEERKICATTAF
jgi:hypothetical protein